MWLLVICYAVLATPALILLGIGYPLRFPARRTRAAAWFLLLTAVTMPALGILWAVAAEIYLRLLS